MSKENEEKMAIRFFLSMCEESINPDLYSILVEKIVPSLEESRHLTGNQKASHLGMYGENPIVQIGKISICEFQIPPDETVWMEHEDGDGMGAQKSDLAPVIEEFYNKYF